MRFKLLPEAGSVRDQMKAAYINRLGSPENIIFGELPEPIIKDSQALVKVVAVAVDPIDTYIRRGTFPTDLSFPFIIGRDMVGTIEAVGVEVERFSVGDRVWCNNQGYCGRQGTFAEYLTIDERFLYPLPDEADEKQAVAVAHSATTALIGLLREARFGPGESIFINGGAGNVGSAVLQLATNLGAHVIVTAGNDADLEYCRQLGAEQAVNYRTGDVVAAISKFAPDGVNVYWDTTTKPDFERCHSYRSALASYLWPVSTPIRRFRLAPSIPRTALCMASPSRTPRPRNCGIAP